MPGSLGEELWARLMAAPDREFCRYVALEEPERTVTAGELIALAAPVRAGLEALDLPHGALVAVVHASGPMLHAAWLGTLFAGFVPTLVAPPSPRMEPRKYAEGFTGIIREIGIEAAVIDDESLAKLDGLMPALPLLRTGALAPAAPREPVPRDPALEAVVQHTSGTTGVQKAIGFTVGQIRRHAEVFAAALALTADDVIVSWLPLYHDMGFIACFIMPPWLGIPLVEMSPFDWVARPAMLLEAIARHRGTLCWLPNFAFKVLSGERLLAAPEADWQLGHVRAFINCSEPVQAASIAQFVTRLAPHGVRRDQVIASYAMAENLFLVTQNPVGRPVSRRFDRRRLAADLQAVPSEDGIELVSNGPPAPSTRIEIRGPGGRIDDGRIGRVWITGTHLFSGYRQAAAPNAAILDGEGWYDTGDLGFIDGGEVYITGRAKELIIIRGRNYYPQDVEAIVGGVEGVNPGRVAAFGVPDEAAGTEKLVIMLELIDGAADQEQAVMLGVRQTVAQLLDTVVGDLRIVPRRSLVKSTSGKVARAENRRRYLEAMDG